MTSRQRVYADRLSGGRTMRDCPMHGIDANSVGTGKSTLGHVVAIIGTGREANTISLPSSEEEFKKVLLSVLLQNPLALMILKSGEFFSLFSRFWSGASSRRPNVR